MPLEQEVPHLLSVGFIFTVLVIAIATIILWLKNKTNGIAYLFILVHLVFLSTAFSFFMNAITLELDYHHPMASEENSLQIGMAGFFWALSMMCLLVAIVKFTNFTSNLRRTHTD